MLSCIGIGWGCRRAIWKKKTYLHAFWWYVVFILIQPPYLQVLFSSSLLSRRHMHGFSFEQIQKLTFFKNTLSQRFKLVQWCKRRSPYTGMWKIVTHVAQNLVRNANFMLKLFFFHRKIISHVLEKQRHINCFNEFYIQKLAVSKLISHTPICELKQVGQQ